MSYTVSETPLVYYARHAENAVKAEGVDLRIVARRREDVITIKGSSYVQGGPRIQLSKDGLILPQPIVWDSTAQPDLDSVVEADNRKWQYYPNHKHATVTVKAKTFTPTIDSTLRWVQATENNNRIQMQGNFSSTAGQWLWTTATTEPVPGVVSWVKIHLEASAGYDPDKKGLAIEFLADGLFAVDAIFDLGPLMRVAQHIQMVRVSNLAEAATHNVETMVGTISPLDYRIIKSTHPLTAKVLASTTFGNNAAQQAEIGILDTSTLKINTVFRARKGQCVVFNSTHHLFAGQGGPTAGTKDYSLNDPGRLSGLRVTAMHVDGVDTAL